MKYDTASKALRDYALLDKLPDNFDAIREAAGRAVEASDLTTQTTQILRTNREQSATPAAAATSPRVHRRSL